MLNSPDVSLRRALRLSPGPLGYDTELFSAGYVANEPQSTTLTSSHNRIQIIDPAAARTIKMPSAGIRAGEVFVIVNRSTSYDVTIQASDASAIDIIRTGFIKIIALQNTPVANTGWYVENVYEEYSYSTTVTNLYATNPTITINVTRNNSQIIIRHTSTTAAAKNTTNDPRTSVVLPARFRVPVTCRIPTIVQNNGTNQTGACLLRDNGRINWEPSGLGSWTAAANAQLFSTHLFYSLL